MIINMFCPYCYSVLIAKYPYCKCHTETGNDNSSIDPGVPTQPYPRRWPKPDYIDGDMA